MTVQVQSRAHRSSKTTEYMAHCQAEFASLVAQANNEGCGVRVEHQDGAVLYYVDPDVRPMHVKEYWR